MALLSILDRLVSKRAGDDEDFGGNWSTLYGAQPRYIYANTAGIRLTESSALALSTYFACIRNLSEDLAKLPIDVVRVIGRNREQLRDHPIRKVLRRPNSEMGGFDFRATWHQHAMAFLGGYAEIVKNERGDPGELYLLDPTATTPMRTESGELFFRYRDKTTQQDYKYPAKDILHLRGPSFDGVSNYSIVYLARQVLGAALAQQEFRGSFFKGGTWLGGVLEAPESLSDEALKHLRESWSERHGGADKAGGIAILEDGLKYHQLGVEPEKAQMVESEQISNEAVCRLFRMPLSKIQQMKDAHFATMEQANQEYVNDAMMPWAIRVEQECEDKLLPMPDPDVEVKFNFKALLRGDSAARATYNKEMWGVSAKSVNDILADEDESGIGPDGDRRFVPANMIPIDLVDGFWESKVSPSAGSVGGQGGEPQPGEEVEEPGNELMQAVIAGYRKVLESIALRVMKKESNAVKRAQNKFDPESVLADFYIKHRIHVAESFEATLQSLGDLFCNQKGIPPLDMSSVLAQYVNEHVELSKAEIHDALDAKVLDQMAEAWLSERPVEIALRLVQLARATVGEMEKTDAQP